MNKETQEDQGHELDIVRRAAINVHVGSRMHGLRLNLKVTSGVLAKKLGVSYQQVRAYENGQNKIPAGVLYLAAEALNVPTSFFFDEMPEGLLPRETDLNADHLNKNEELNIFSVTDIKAVETEIRSVIDVYYLIDSPIIRRGMIDFMKVIGKEF